MSAPRAWCLMAVALGVLPACGGGEARPAAPGAPAVVPSYAVPAGPDPAGMAEPTSPASMPDPQPASGGASAPSPSPIMCGERTCSVPILPIVPPGFTFTPCCAIGGECGISGEGVGLTPGVCIPANVPGTWNADCPGVVIEVNAVENYGCCTRSGTCGTKVASTRPNPLLGDTCIDATLLGMPPGPTCDPANVCSIFGEPCVADTDCCHLPRGTMCAEFVPGSPTCTDACSEPAGCASSCCRRMPDGRGACAPADQCPGGCSPADALCRIDGHCCDGLVCVETAPGGPHVCKPA